jgi:hypothetical protein
VVVLDQDMAESPMLPADRPAPQFALSARTDLVAVLLKAPCSRRSSQRITGTFFLILSRLRGLSAVVLMPGAADP